MVSRTERGLLLTCLWYIREVDPATMLLTGLTRDGVYVIEDGEVVGASNNFRFNESPVDLLARASEVGATERSLGRGVRRIPQPYPYATTSDPRLQHELGQSSQLNTPVARWSRPSPMEGAPGEPPSNVLVIQSAPDRSPPTPEPAL